MAKKKLNLKLPLTDAEFLSCSANFYSDGKPFLVHCPNCKRENYSPAVASGQCSWCGVRARRQKR